MELKNILIYSDMDGTMLTDWDRGPVVPERNLAAITRFMNEGGSFSIASGRQHTDILGFFPGFEFNAPIVQGNGASLYDCQKKTVFARLPLSRQYKEESIAFARANPWVWVVAADTRTVMQINMGDDRDRVTRALKENRISIEEYLTGEYVKIVYVVADPADMPRLRELTAHFTCAPEISASMSSPVFLETFDCRASKALGIQKARDYANLNHKTLVCVGDYYNDKEMLELADIAVCPSNAPEDLKALAHIITCNNNEGALADLIEALERM